jgi:hypothetical protein
VKRLAAFFLALLLPAALFAARGVFRDYPLPAADAQPTGIVISVHSEIWFTQFAANKIGRISQTGELTEYSIPTPNSGPLGIASFPTSRDVWFTEFNANKIGRITREGIITEFPIPTPASGPFGITGSGPMGNVPEAIRNPSVLAFPTASKTPGIHSNLVVAEVGYDDGITVRADAISANGELLGSSSFQIATGSTLFLVDALSQLGVPELDSGQIRVTRIGGTGLMWGLLATLSNDGRITVSPGMNP